MPQPILDADVVIVGGGVIGSAVAWQLACAGVRDVLVVERNEIGSGTTSSSAGLLGQLRPTVSVMRLIRKTFEAIRQLEKELGEPVGFREVGSLRVAATEERERELDDLQALGRAEGIAVERIDRATAERLVPEFRKRCALARSGFHAIEPARSP